MLAAADAGMLEKRKMGRKEFAATTELKRLMADYYQELDHASDAGKRVAWCSSMGPVEILRALGFLVYFPEHHSAMLGASRMATEFIPYANALGYAPEICSYLTADIGAFVQGVTPLSKAYQGIDHVPRPDVLVFNTNQCRDVQDWFAWYARQLGVPLVGIYSYRGIGEVTEKHISSISAQLRAMADALGEISGKALDIDELRRVVALAMDCSTLWKKILDTAVAVPSPLTFFDGATLMAPAVVGRGTEWAVDFYRMLHAELKERVDKHIGAVDGERHRIYWEGMPIWGRLRDHSELFAGLKACVLASTYCSSWVFSALQAEKPFESMARAYTELFIARSDAVKEKYIKERVAFFKVDGVVFHDARTCPNNSNCRYAMPRRLEADTGVPSLIISGDLNDLRCLSDEQTHTSIEAFVEQLEEGRSSAD